MNDAGRQVGLLSILHFVVAGIAGLITLIPISIVPLGISMLAYSILQWDMSQLGASLFILFFGLGYFLLPAVFTLIGLAFTVCMAAVGFFLLKKRNYTFCRFMAWVECLFIPLGTILGVITAIVLARPAVKELFGVPVLAARALPST